MVRIRLLGFLVAASSFASVWTFTPSPLQIPLRRGIDATDWRVAAKARTSFPRAYVRPPSQLYGLNGEPNGEANGDANGGIDWTKVQPQVSEQRWIQLGYLSVLALLSDWICFSTAATPSTFEEVFPGHSAAGLIDMFLFTNVASCFLVTDVVAKFGLQRAIQGAAALMALGCWFRSGLGFLVPTAHAVGLDTLADTLQSSDLIATTTAASSNVVPYPFIVAGTLMVGAAQPFFQCTPPLLSAQWFASDERATSTAVALNFNQIGIATAFLVGGAMATSATGLENYFALIAVLATVVAFGTLLQFQDMPKFPPSSSELEKRISGEQEPPFLDSVKKFFQTPGFSRPLAAFICSISITNIVGTFIDEVMCRGGIEDQLSIDLAGAGFELAILLGGIIIGGYVDRTKEYKSVTLTCLATTAALLVPLGLTEHAIGKEPLLLVVSLLGLGLAAGPVQPINAELAVDVTYPGDETAVESIQQIGGNLISALLVPVAEVAAQKDYQLLPKIPSLASDIRGDVILLVTVALVTYAYFSGFDAPLKRTAADCASNDDDVGCQTGVAIDSMERVIDVSVNKKDSFSKEVINKA
uniref:Major facilitator superfamily (MFS) profile domain-containing protein n=1 Tax=Grammatophora oceanica TaxID=210454 RepID=A0A7S1Y381_9STRA|mmetsp:Transcript_1524/g.2087  ORF Transcript_1524/g.2087 Transcript_1524/m.2087 type:complete len:585 (+) Transcript_1524:137-1891(+)